MKENVVKLTKSEKDVQLEYESLPTQNPWIHMTAGAAAGILEHCVLYPIDSVKTRMQILKPDPRAKYRNVYQAFRQIIHEESFLATMKGVSITAYGSGPAHAVYFACYEFVKGVLQSKDSMISSRPFSHAVAGGFATFFHDIVYNPFEVIKQRMQVYKSPHPNWLHCLHHVLKEEGPSAFYRSFGTQLAMNVPYQSLHFVVYEFTQEKLNPKRQYLPLSHVLSGSCAGAVAAFATTPFDVAKTLLNTTASRTTSCSGSNNRDGDGLIKSTNSERTMNIGTTNSQSRFGSANNCRLDDIGASEVLSGTRSVSVGVGDEVPRRLLYSNRMVGTRNSKLSNKQKDAIKISVKNNCNNFDLYKYTDINDNNNSNNNNNRKRPEGLSRDDKINAIKNLPPNRTSVSGNEVVDAGSNSNRSITGDKITNGRDRIKFRTGDGIKSILSQWRDSIKDGFRRRFEVKKGLNGSSWALWGAAGQIYRSGGVRAFFAGTVPRVIYQVPSTAIAWTTYEFFKFFLSDR